MKCRYRGVPKLSSWNWRRNQPRTLREWSGRWEGNQEVRVFSQPRKESFRKEGEINRVSQVRTEECPWIWPREGQFTGE